MKIQDARDIIARGEPETRFRVVFEWRDRGSLHVVGDGFPEINEPLIVDEGEAWRLAEAFAKALTGERVCNVYVARYRVVLGAAPEFVGPSSSTRKLLPR